MQAGIFWGIVGVAAVWSARSPDLNWDGIAYVALALERSGVEPADAHALAYGQLREIAPDERYRDLTEASAYRARMAADPAAFGATLGFYRMRQGYVGLLSGAHAFLGGNPFWASVAIGVVAHLLLAWALWGWMEEWVGDTWWRLLALPLLLQPAVLGGIPLTTPDFLAAALLVVGAYQLLIRRALGEGGAFLLLAVLCRPDVMILACPLVLVPALAQVLAGGLDAKLLRDHGWGIGLCLALALLGGGVIVVSGAHPWSAVFRHTFLLHEELPGEAAAVGWLEYARVVGTAIVYLGSGKVARILFCLAAVGVAYLVWHPLVPRERKVLACVTLAAWVAFFFLFPLPLERFYVAHFCLIGASLAATVGEFAALAQAREGSFALTLIALLRGRSIEGERLVPLPPS